MIGRFAYLKVGLGLGLVLTFVGATMAASDIFKVPIGLSLAIVAAFIAGSIAVSLLRPSRPAPLPVPEPPE